jgi:glycosyltransferase involved in cell wall biosynthesis
MQINSFLNNPPNISRHSADKTDKNYVFSILIPTWNNLDFLKTCVESIRKNSRYPHQIIVHLNEGTDGSKEWAEQEGIDFTLSDTNIGICYAMNFARTLATCDLLVYFNDDMYACPDWDYWLYEETLKANTPYFFISSTLIEPRSTGNQCVIAPMDFGRSPSSFSEKALLENYYLPQKNDWNGATWPPSILPTKLWDLVGGYGAEFSPGMYSDPDFSMKLWHFGVRYFKGVGASRVYHFMSQSTKKLSKPKINGSKIFLRKWGVSSNLFTRFYLRRGEVWKGPLSEPDNNLKFKFKKLLGNIKRLVS